jgi:hypothetical protein
MTDATEVEVANGIARIPFVPCLKKKHVAPVVHEPKVRELEVKDAGHRFASHDDDHIIIAGNGETDKVAGFYGFKEGDAERPITEIKDGKEIEQTPVEEFDAPKKQEPKTKEPVKAVETKKKEKGDEGALATKIDTLLAEKKYDEAFQQLKDFYGEDAITFSIRAVRAAKNFKSLKTRYKF